MKKNMWEQECKKREEGKATGGRQKSGNQSAYGEEVSEKARSAWAGFWELTWHNFYAEFRVMLSWIEIQEIGPTFGRFWDP